MDLEGPLHRCDEPMLESVAGKEGRPGDTEGDGEGAVLRGLGPPCCASVPQGHPTPLPILCPQCKASHQDVGDESHRCRRADIDSGQRKGHVGLLATQSSAPDVPRGGGCGAGQGQTWNIEVRSVDIEAGGHWGVLLVLYLPVL